MIRIDANVPSFSFRLADFSTCLARLAVIVLATAWLTDNCLDPADLRRSDLALLVVVGVRPGQMARAKVSTLFSIFSLISPTEFSTC